MPVKRKVAKARRLERPVAKRGQFSWAPDGPPAGCILDEDLAERAGFYVLIAHSDLNELIQVAEIVSTEQTQFQK